MINKAVLFDMDGVLVDSEPVIEAAAIKGLSEYGVLAQAEDFIPFVGAGEDRYIGGVANKYGVEYKLEMKARVYEIYLKLVDDNLKLYEGVNEVLLALQNKGYKLVLASSADRIKIDANLRVAHINPENFGVILSGDDVINKKPSPEIYLLAAKRLGIETHNCIVIEDALNGIQAAKSAGMKSIGISTSFSMSELMFEGADFACEDIRKITQWIFSNM